MATRSDVQARLAELARRPPGARPVVSVYLNTRWTDENQRARVRIFLKNRLREARAAAERPAEQDLAWIEAQGQRIIGQHLARLDEQADTVAVNRMLDAAARGGRAVAGVGPTLEAVNRNAVQHLYLIRSFERPGAACEQCAALQPPVSGTCLFCGAATQPTELGEAMTGRVLASGGEISVVVRHGGLSGHDGVGVLLRYVA